MLWPQCQSSTFIIPHSFNICVLNIQQQQDTREKRSNTASEKEEEEDEEGHKAESAALTGSLCTQLGCSNPYLYDQFNLQTTEQKINQITLLQVGTCARNSWVLVKH